jgi:hypothetical protein
MAESYYNAASGNWSTSANWKGGTGGDGTLPQSGDDVYANGKAIVIDQSITVNSLRTTAGTTAVAGGSFTVSSTGRTVTVGSIVTGSSNCFTFAGAGGTTCNLVISGAATGSLTTASAVAIRMNSTGTLNVSGNVVGGSQTSAAGVQVSSAGTLAITGNVTGGSGSAANGVIISVAATVSVSGTSTGGSVASCYGVNNNSTGVTTLANVTGGSGAGSSYGGYNSSTGQMLTTGTITASSTSPALSDVSSNAGFVRVAGPVVNSTGINAITATRLCLVAACDWTIAVAGTPPAYNGTVTIGLKGGSGGGGRILKSSIIGAVS